MLVYSTLLALRIIAFIVVVGIWRKLECESINVKFLEFDHQYLPLVT